jgi:hypothetical protein
MGCNMPAGRPYIGPKVQTQVPPGTLAWIRARQKAEGKTEAEVVRDYIELGIEASKRLTLVGVK